MAIKQDIEQSIIENIRLTLEKLIDESALEIGKEEIPSIQIEVPREEKFGDFSVNIAMRLAKSAKKNPREIAMLIVDNFPNDIKYIKEISIAGAGFINFKLDNLWLYDQLREVLNEKENFGRFEENGESINVEYVSANPTGPLHIGNARGGAIGDVMSNLFNWAGYKVTKEFYLNDAGNQIMKFGASLSARYLQALGEKVDFPEDGYKGEDVKLLANEYIKLCGDGLKDVSKNEREKTLVTFALDKNTQKMICDLRDYGIYYDVFFSEKSLHNSGAIDSVIDKLRENGAVYEKDDAVWFKATDYGLEKDEVLIRNNSVPTYYAADIAYHYDKLVKRGYTRAINVWGADHHGHVQRLKMALKALGIDETRLDIILMQLVHLVKGNEAYRMSKRKGDVYTLSDLIEEVKTDAARFTFNYYKPTTHMDFDLDLAIKESNENPVFYVQYAHARICSIVRKIGEEISITNLDMLDKEEELGLLKIISKFPEEVLNAVDELDPSKMTKYACKLAAAFHSFYNAHRVNVEDERLLNARLCLVSATRQVLNNVLDILGVSAPEKM